MRLREALEDLPAMPIPKPRFRSEPLVTVEKNRIAARFSEVASMPETEDLKSVAERLWRAVRENSSIPLRDWRNAAWCLWHPASMLIEDELFRSRYLSFIAQESPRGPIRSLCSSYLISFSPTLAWLDHVSMSLAEGVKRFDWVWRKHGEGFGLFDPSRAPHRLAQHCLDLKLTPATLFSNLGLRGQATLKGLVEHVFCEGAIRLGRQRMHDDPDAVLDEIKSWSEGENREFLYSSQGPALADAVLAAWVDERPPDLFRRRASDFLLGRLGDPRIHPERWSRMPDAAVIMRRWLTEQSLEQFFEIVDETAFRDHWDYRKAFWLAVYRACVSHGRPMEAWVAFGPAAAQRARRAFGQSTAFGKLRKGGWKNVESGHSVLLLKLGRTSVADWSHNGKCYLWGPDAAGAPKLYQQEYTSSDVAQHGTSGIVHAHPRNYSWQMKVAAELRDLTEVHVYQRDYAVTKRR